MKKFTFMFLLACFSLSAFSARYLVNSSTTSWADPTASGGTAVTLTGSLNEWFNATTMAAGDEVWLAAGTFTLTDSICLKEGVNLFGSFAGNETAVSGRAVGADPWTFTNQTTIDGGFGFGIAPAATVATRVDGLKFTHTDEFTMGNLKTNYIIANCISDKGKLIITDAQLITSYFTGRTTSSAVQAYMGVNLLIKGCKFESNTSTGQGGALGVNKSLVEPFVSDGTIEDCIFNENTATKGGAINLFYDGTIYSDSVRIVNCQFIKNTGTATGINGGAIFLNNAATRVIIDKCSFVGNSVTNSSGGGGAIGINSAKVVIGNSIFRNNTSNTKGVISGLNSWQVKIFNCVIVNNSGGAAGSLIALSNTTSFGLEIYNSTIANNTSVGPAIAFPGFDTLAIMKNNLVFGNTGGTRNTNNTSIESDFNAFDVAPPTDEGTNSITGILAESFVLPTSFAGAPSDEAQKTESAAADWSIKSDSPAKDAGTDLSAVGVVTDILGVMRPMYTAYDIGAYEIDYATGLKTNLVNNLKVYPSFTKGIINIESEVKEILLYDLNGRTLGKWFNTNQIDITSKPSGIYLLQLKNSDGKIMNYKIGKE